MKEIPINGYDRYLITEDGKVWAKHLSRFLKPVDNGLGYLQYKIRDNTGKRKAFYAHRLVALCYLDNPSELTDVNHKDGNKSNNHVSNLEWSSHKDNLKHAHKLGLLKGYYGCSCGVCRTCMSAG